MYWLWNLYKRMFKGDRDTRWDSKNKNKNKDCLKDAIIVCPQRAIKEIKQDLLFAIGTDQDQLIKQNDHVGISKYFQIWKYSNGNLDFKEKRENVKIQRRWGKDSWRF